MSGMSGEGSYVSPRITSFRGAGEIVVSGVRGISRIT